MAGFILSVYIVVSKILQRNKSSPFWKNFTGPECGTKKSHPTKKYFRLCISRSIYIRNHGRQNFACQHKVFPSMQCLPMLTLRIEQDINQPSSCLSWAWVSTRLCSSTVAKGRCVSPFHSASFSEPSGPLVRSHVITGVRQFGYQTTVPQNSCGWCILNPA